jgi:hypothetical protein
MFSRMSSIHTDDQGTVHVTGVVTARCALELPRMVGDAFLLRDEPLTTLRLTFEAATTVDDDAIGPLRAALAHAVAVCAGRSAVLRIVPSPSMSALSTA